MARVFYRSTAELVIQVTDAVFVSSGTTAMDIADFCDLSKEQAENALLLSQDLGLVQESSGHFSRGNPIGRFFSVPTESQKAALLRILLESYEPFTVFRDRLRATGSAETAAQHTKSLLDLDAHREEVKDTLIGLGTYSGAVSVEGGGQYSIREAPLTNQFVEVSEACGDIAAAEAKIMEELGECGDKVDRSEVVQPLAQALLKAQAGNFADAVGDAANAVESYLFRLAARLSVSLSGANGLSQKADRFRTGDHLPKKLVESLRYLAQIRNAADHGVDADPEVSAVWLIQDSTGLLYIFVACAFIRACNAREQNLGYWI